MVDGLGPEIKRQTQPSIPKTPELRVEFALQIATELHRGQFRKNGQLPYIAHIYDVLSRLSLWGVDRDKHIDVWLAAIFHDVLEDTPVQLEEIAKKIGEGLWTTYVQELTFDPKKYASKQEYLDSFDTKSTQSLLIKIADRLCNFRDFRYQDLQYAPKYLFKATVLFETFKSAQPILFDGKVYAGCLIDIITNIETATLMRGASNG